MPNATSRRMPHLYLAPLKLPFDKGCERVVRGLEERGWCVPNISVQFGTNYPGIKWDPRLHLIKGYGCELRFGTSYYNPGSTIIKEIVTPRHELRVDECSDLTCAASDIFVEVAEWLEANLLPRIVGTPVPSIIKDIFYEEAIPFPKNLGRIFYFGQLSDVKRIRNGRNGIENDRYALNMYNGHTVTVNGDGSVTDSYERSLKCSLIEADTTSINALRIPGNSHSMGKLQYVFEITPNRANGIWVGDLSRQPEQALMPAAKYNGEYDKPFIVISRDPNFSEVEPVSGPWRGLEDVGTPRAKKRGETHPKILYFSLLILL